MGNSVVSLVSTVAGSNLYVGTSGGTSTTAFTSTMSTASGSGTPLSGGGDWGGQGPPLRIAQRTPMPVVPLINPKYLENVPHEHLEEVIKRELDHCNIDVKTIEIPAYRIARGLNWHKVKPNSLLELPDGTIIDIEDDHHYTIHDSNTRVAREHCTIQAFNRFLNASELLEAFIKDMAPSGIRQDQVLKVPIEGFINWLIFQAAKADGDDLPEQYYNHRCIYCQKFIARKLVVMGVNFCNPQHLDGYLNRTKLLENN